MGRGGGFDLGAHGGHARARAGARRATTPARVDRVRSCRAEQSHAEPWTWKWVAAQECVRHTELPRQSTYLRLIQLLEGLANTALANHLLDQRYTIVVCLDHLGMLSTSRLNRVWVDCSLAKHKSFNAHARGFSLVDGYELVPDNVTLSLRHSLSLESLKKFVGGVDKRQRVAQA